MENFNEVTIFLLAQNLFPPSVRPDGVILVLQVLSNSVKSCNHCNSEIGFGAKGLSLVPVVVIYGPKCLFWGQDFYLVEQKVARGFSFDVISGGGNPNDYFPTHKGFSFSQAFFPSLSQISHE
ncbi:hypothetical protein Tco_1066942 [Tanacetum coccineum]|uniref:Uncharacterized protein n=1 Tax=Tanacetum coccineum TaxID=301880 RepID=A0ABQ5HC16_9ASTR